MVVSDKLFTPDEYIKLSTGECYKNPIKNMSDIQYIRQFLYTYLDGMYFHLRDFPLSKIDHIVENKRDVVLVKCREFDDNGDEYFEFRWFEVE